MRVLLDKRQMDLKDFLAQYGSQLKNVRAFYIVEPLLEKGKTIKFGIAGMSTGNAYHRLNQYQVLYGEKTKQNNCKGVIVHYVGVTEYNRQVQMERSQIYQLEKFLKTEYKSTTEPGRGSERVSKDFLQDILRTIRSKRFKDIPTQLRDTNRPTTKIHQKDTRAFIDSTSGPVTRRQK